MRERNTRPFRHLFVMSAFILAPFMAGAQTPAYSYRINIVPRSTEVSVKDLISLLTSTYDILDLEIENEDRGLRFVTTDHLSWGALIQLGDQSGHRIIGSIGLDHRDGSTEEAGIAPMPQRIDTGDEQADHARYEAAKADWIARYPEEYQRMIARPTTTDKDDL